MSPDQQAERLPATSTKLRDETPGPRELAAELMLEAARDINPARIGRHLRRRLPHLSRSEIGEVFRQVDELIATADVTIVFAKEGE